MQKMYKKLILVEVNDDKAGKKAGQSNKYYEMIWDGGSTFTVKYGRVESTEQTCTYSYYDWNKKYAEKIRKGYKDVTDMVSVEVEETTSKQQEVEIEKGTDGEVYSFLVAMKRYTDGLVSRTYSVKSDKVSQKQVDEAQKILDELADLGQSKKKNVTLINTKLVELYTVIPRYIKDVRKEILPHIDLDKTIVQEQDNLDAMASQVNMNKKNVIVDKKETKQKMDLLSKMGVEMRTIKPNKEVDEYVRQLTGKKVKAVFEIKKPWEDERFDRWLKGQTNKKTSIVIHGTRCTSVIPILEQGLKVRPASNFQFSGKVYGNGNYFSEECDTSLCYTGNDSDRVLLVYEVHSGKASYNSYANYNQCRDAGYDSFAMKGTANRHMMRVMYREEQARIKYAIWLKN